MSDLRPAVPQLVALAAAMRTDWDPEDLDMAILAATQAGWEWERIAREVWRLLFTEDGSPVSLRAACSRPHDRPAAAWKPAPAGSGLPKADEVRALVEAAREAIGAATPKVRGDGDPPRTAA